jgi:4-amino-4-deoxy-L-arabinose transferase-like glycosyltransferase
MDKDKINITPYFVIFIILHILIWSVLPLLRQILPIDAMECIYWGGLGDFGTNKHPPLAGWLAYFTYTILGKTDFSIYFLGQLSIITGFIYIFKLGKLFLPKIQALLSVMIMEACFVYTYMGIYDGFNPNFLLLALLPMITYYFYKSINNDKLSNWIKLGVCVGLSFLAKYQTIMLFIPLFIFLLITQKGREQFKEKGFYIAAITAFLIALPHIIWLYKNDFFSLNYFVNCEERYETFYEGPLRFLWSPVAFLFNQILAVLGVIFIYFTAFLFSKEKFQQTEKIKTDKIFLICAGIIPIGLQTLSGLNGNYLIPQWGYSLLFMTGILLFYFFPFKLSNKTIKYIISWVFTAMFITFVVLAIVFATEKNFANRFPVKQVTNTLDKIYYSETGQKMKYIGGFIELAIPISLYNDKKYIMVLNTYNHENPWIDENDVKKSGQIILSRHQDTMKDYVNTENLQQKPKPFKFTVKSFIGKEREYEMFYVIIPPVLKEN